MVTWAACSLSSNVFIEARLAGCWAEPSFVFQIFWQMGRVLCERPLSKREDKFEPWPRSGRTAETSVMVGGLIVGGAGASSFSTSALQQDLPLEQKSECQKSCGTNWDNLGGIKHRAREGSMLTTVDDMEDSRLRTEIYVLK